VTDRFRWTPELTTAGSGRPLLRDPVRLGLVTGAIVMAIAMLLPWAEGHIGFLAKQFGGLDGAADGLIMSGLGIVLVVLVRTPEFLESSDGGRRWVPMLIGLACVALWLLGGQQGLMEIKSWEEDSGGGSLAVGWWLAGVGALLVAIVGSYASLRRRPDRQSRPEPPPTARTPPRRRPVESLATTAGAVAGTVAGAAFALAMFPAVSVGAPMVFFGGLGLVFGGFAGSSLGQRLARRRQ
jgi:hypothetical protein